MALYTDLASLSQTAGANAADGSTDAPSTIDQQTNLLASFIAQLRDGKGFTTGAGYVAQCRLTKSGSNLLLSRFNGTGLTINGVPYAIPSGGVTLAPTGLSPNVLYYVYAFMNAGTMTLEAVTTGHSTDATTGIEIKTGDATRTLVGMCVPQVGPVFADSATQRLVASRFNRRSARMAYVNLIPFPYSLGTFAYINTFQNLEFLTWGDEPVQVWTAIQISHSATNGVVQTGVALDTTNTPNVDTPDLWQAYVAGANGTASFVGQSAPAEGYHFYSLCGATSGLSATWAAGGTFAATVVI